MEVQRNMLNACDIVLFYKVVGWFDGQDNSVEPRRPRFNPLYQHILCGVCIFINLPYIYVCKYIILRSVVDRWVGGH
jgi:hypothetical protein